MLRWRWAAIVLKHWVFQSLAGAAGIEPANAGIKSRCLTAWRRPNKEFALHIEYNDHQLAGPYSVSQNERNRRFRSFTPRFFSPIHARLVRYRVGYPPVARAVFALFVQGHLLQ
jgi:hypothetical protein